MMKTHVGALQCSGYMTRPLPSCNQVAATSCAQPRLVVASAAPKRVTYQDMSGYSNGGYINQGAGNPAFTDFDQWSFMDDNNNNNNNNNMNWGQLPPYGQQPRQGGYNNTQNQNTQRYPAQRMPIVDYRNNQQLDSFAEDEGDYEPSAYDLAPAGAEVTPQQRTVNGKQMLINNEIRASQVRVIAGDKGKQQRGVMSLREALALARDLEVDLCLINADADPPLCRLVTWSKYKYEVEKDQKKKASKAAVVETKEVRLRPGTDVGDINTKLKSAMKFLEKGNKVKIAMKFEGRELQHKDQGKAVMLKFIEDLAGVAKLDGSVNFKTSTYTAIVAPLSRQQQESSKKAEETAAQTAAAAVAAGAAAAAAVTNGKQLPLPPSTIPLPPNSSTLTAAPAGLPMPPAPPANIPHAAPQVARNGNPAGPSQLAPPPPVTPPTAPAPASMPRPPVAPTPVPPAPVNVPQRPAGPGVVPPRQPPLQPTMPAGIPQLQPQRPGIMPPPLQRPGMMPPANRPMTMPPMPPVKVPVPAAAK